MLRGEATLRPARVNSLRRLGRTADARAADEQAHWLTANGVEREFLLRRLEQLSG